MDSSLLLVAAHDALGSRALGVTARSPTCPAHELEQAVAIARSIGARHQLIDSREMEDADYAHGDRARVELARDELDRALGAEGRRRLVEICRQQGRTFVRLDLEGYRTGSMNEVLTLKTRADEVAP